MLVALVSALFLGEVLNGVETLGVVIITASIAGLALAGDVAGLSSNAVLFSLGTSVTIAGYTIADGSGARVSGAPIAYIAWLFVINAFPLLFVLPVLRPGLGLRALGRQSKTGLLGGVLSVGAYGLAIWAMTRAPIALVSALRETSVVLAAILGATFLREPFGPRRVLAAIGVALGIIVLRLAG